MKYYTTHPGKKILTAIMFLTCMGMFVSCARKINFNTSSTVPAAEGRVKVKKDNNGNYSLDIEVKNLSAPTRLTPSKKMYIVWMDTESNGTKNLGQLVTSSALLSSAMKASLNATTPYKPTKVYITAEDEASLEYPGYQSVLTTESFNVK